MRRFFPLAFLLVLAGCSQPPEGDPTPGAMTAKAAETYAPDALNGQVDVPTGTKITPSTDKP